MKLSKKVMKKAQDENERLHQEALDACIPIAQEIFKIIVDSGIKMGDGDFMKTRPKEYVEASKRIMQMMVERNVNWVDRNFIFQLVLQPISHFQSIILQDLQRTFEYQICNLFGVSSFDELKMQDVNEGLLRLAKPLTPEEKEFVAKQRAATEALSEGKAEAEKES